MDVFGVPIQALAAQLALGLVNGSFYAILSLGLAVIFGMLNIINFAHGALYMLGAMLAWIGLNHFGVNYWIALLLVPLLVGVFGIVIERSLLKWTYDLDHIYGLLLTFGLAFILEGVFHYQYGSAGMNYNTPDVMAGVTDLGFMMMPTYRIWTVFASVSVCLAVWFFIEKTRLGAYLRASTENPHLTQTFGINVPVLVMLTYGVGAALAGYAGVLAAPLTQVTPLMGSDLIIVVFAVVVIGGLGSIFGAVVTGLFLGLVEALAKVYVPELSATVVFIIMAIVLLVRPAGLFGKGA